MENRVSSRVQRVTGSGCGLCRRRLSTTTRKLGLVRRRTRRKTVPGESATVASPEGPWTVGSPPALPICFVSVRPAGNRVLVPPENRSPSPDLPQSLGISLPISHSHLSVSLSRSISLSLISQSLCLTRTEERRTRNEEQERRRQK